MKSIGELAQRESVTNRATQMKFVTIFTQTEFLDEILFFGFSFLSIKVYILNRIKSFLPQYYLNFTKRETHCFPPFPSIGQTKNYPIDQRVSLLLTL